MLASPDLTRRLFDRSADEDVDLSGAPSDDSLATGLLKRGTTVALQTIYGDEPVQVESARWELATDVGDVKMLGDVDDDPSLARVVIPGDGVCSVRRDQLIPTNERRSAGGVARLKLVRSHLGQRAFHRLLVLVGPSLTHLTLEMPDVGSPWSASILCACRSLKELVVEGKLIDTSSLLEVFETFELDLEAIDGSFDDLPLLVQALSDKTTWLECSLKRLTCDIGRTNPEVGSPLDDMKRMLEANGTLEYLHVHMPSHWSGDGAAEIERFNNQEIPVRDTPFPLESRVAFLSVFADAKRIPDETATPASRAMVKFLMDRDVLSLIFEYAAVCVRRRVYVTGY